MTAEYTDQPNTNSPTSGSEPALPPPASPGAMMGQQTALRGLPTPAPQGTPDLVLGPVRRRGILPLLLLLLVAAAGVVGWRWWVHPLDVATVHPGRGDAIEAVYATGMIEAVDKARVGTTVAGRIAALSVDEGDVVTEGQVMARIDDRAPRQRVADATSRLTLAQQELDRDQALAARGDRSLQALQRSLRERDSAAALLEMARRDLGEHVITAPLSGIVMKRLVQEGETVAANAALFEVASRRHLRVAADVDERDIALIRMGAPVAVRAEAFPDHAFRATVTRIRLQGDPSTRTYLVEADLPDDTSLFIGMTVDVNIQVAVRHDALLLPSSALQYGTAEGGRPGPAFVYRVVDGRAVRTPVQTGAIGQQKAEIRAGLTASDTVILSPAAELRDGQRVQARS
ncbi:MAG: efflux RND transporter periplasmic adaptor subunit [Acetobacteraceae bacterium]